MSEGKKSVTKILTVIITALTVIIGIFAAAIIINMVICRVQNRAVSFFGYSFAVVQTPSMEPNIMTGDLIVYRTCSYSDVEVGDVIVFIAGEHFPAGIQGQSIVHRANEITENGIRTKGDNNSATDVDLVTEANLLGICTGNSSFWGLVFTAISKYGIFIIIAIIAVPFIIGQIIKIVKLSKKTNGGAEENAAQISKIESAGEQVDVKSEIDKSEGGTEKSDSADGN